MQIDIHHGATYLLCRMAGMKSKYAEKVSYCAQHVDDADYGHALVFENGGVFRQTQTAYRKIDPDNFDINAAYNVLVPFHFLPEDEPFENQKGVVTNPDSKILEKLKNDIISKGSSEIGLYRLGIGLHCYEDIFSHQDFIGFRSGYNDVDLLEGDSGEIHIKLFKDYVPIGHAPVAHNPDLPYQEWAYSRGDEIKEISNLEERFLPALKEIYNFIVKFLEKNTQYALSNTKPKDFMDFKKKIVSLLEYQGDTEERHKNWLDKIKNNEFDLEGHNDIDENINYDDRKWFKEVVEVNNHEVSDNFIICIVRDNENYIKKEGFENSDWVKFMLAAEEHKYIVNKKIVNM